MRTVTYSVEAAPEAEQNISWESGYSFQVTRAITPPESLQNQN
jgi:hypothetical protein